MVNRLKNYFPMIRERKEVLEEICSNHRLQALFQSWEKAVSYTHLDRDGRFSEYYILKNSGEGLSLIHIFV